MNNFFGFKLIFIMIVLLWTGAGTSGKSADVISLINSINIILSAYKRLKCMNKYKMNDIFDELQCKPTHGIFMGGIVFQEIYSDMINFYE